MSVRNQEPKSLWNHFADLNAVPRPSKKEERVIEFMMNFGRELNLETIKDEIGNVVIKKPASPGMENRKKVILQSHLDMVHQKNGDTIFDFDKEGIKMRVQGDWIDAEGTTLGADNGIGVATIMATLSSNDIEHPPIEALFTIDEETGMTGAKEMDGSLFQGDILLNLDTEDDDELSIGCAGGIDTNTTYNYEKVEAPKNATSFRIEIKGLLGGHSGMDIDSGRGNANKWMARILWNLSQKNTIYINDFDGGGLRNAIPREATASFSTAGELSQIQNEFNIQKQVLVSEYKSIEGNISIEISKIANEGNVVSELDSKKILNTLCSLHNGVYRMSPDIKGLVETSSSLARVLISEGVFVTQSLQRSSVESTKDEIAMTIKSAFENMGCAVAQSGDYPGWEPNPNSDILTIMEDLYKKLFNENPQVKACHAGLECGILGTHLPDVDMISFGPNIRAAHSPDEKVQISSVQKFWRYYIETLKAIPVK
ncbi:MAG: aminoacyl-histidine dipeptidase [Crocinitomicaceae bacterium]|nr:aminoacyl-histidine dipeptidase [Crocinitomicaceae bacterium]MDG1734411.1 aminoacyl-histidine dipeptidase [Crocinitomicaceae bacterium]